MAERFLYPNEYTLPPFQEGEVLRRTPNFHIVTGNKPGIERQSIGEHIFINPSTNKGLKVLLQAAAAHNIYAFDHLPHPYNPPGQSNEIPALRAEYNQTNYRLLMQGEVQIPNPGEYTIPSPDRMEEVLAKTNSNAIYTFADDLPHEHGIPNPITRKLRILQVITSDKIPNEIIHSSSPNPYFKVRKGVLLAIILNLNLGLTTGEFCDPNLVADIKSFTENYGNDFMEPSRLTNEIDIEAVNNLLNKIWQNHGTPAQER